MTSYSSAKTTFLAVIQPYNSGTDCDQLHICSDTALMTLILVSTLKLWYFVLRITSTSQARNLTVFLSLNKLTQSFRYTNRSSFGLLRLSFRRLLMWRPRSVLCAPQLVNPSCMLVEVSLLNIYWRKAKGQKSQERKQVNTFGGQYYSHNGLLV